MISLTLSTASVKISVKISPVPQDVKNPALYFLTEPFLDNFQVKLFSHKVYANFT